MCQPQIAAKSAAFCQVLHRMKLSCTLLSTEPSIAAFPWPLHLRFTDENCPWHPQNARVAWLN
jgi:hypothetical protein